MSRLQSYLNQKAPSNIEDVIQRIDNISTLPVIAMKVIEMANDPDSGAADLKQVMESDAALAARVLRCVNSSAYAVRTKITNLQQAIAYLGLKQIRNLALTASVSELFRGEESIGTYQRSQLWRHLVSTGLCARLIAMRRNFDNFEDIFMAGLLHDIGVIFEDQYAHDSFCKTMQSLDPEKTLVVVEHECMGFCHTILGARVAEAWNFPKPVIDTIRHHHSSTHYKGSHVTTVQCVEVANLLCTLKGISSVGMKLLKNSQPALKGLSLTKEDILVLANDLDHEITLHSNLFEL